MRVLNNYEINAISGGQLKVIYTPSASVHTLVKETIVAFVAYLFGAEIQFSVPVPNVPIGSIQNVSAYIPGFTQNNGNNENGEKGAEV